METSLTRAKEEVRPVLLAEWADGEKPQRLPTGSWVYALAIPLSVVVPFFLRYGASYAIYIPVAFVAVAEAFRTSLFAFSKSVRKLGDIPSPAIQFQCSVILFCQKVEVGVDYGLVTFLDGVMYFHGLNASFSLRSQDVTVVRRPVPTKPQVLSGRLPTGQLFSVTIIPKNTNNNPDYFGRFERELERYGNEAACAVGYSTYPPVERRSPLFLGLDHRAFLQAGLDACFTAWYVGDCLATQGFDVVRILIILFFGLVVLAGILYANWKRTRAANYLATRIRAQTRVKSLP